MADSDNALATRQLRSGLRLTELGLGAAQLGNLWRAIGDDESYETVAAAYAAGIRYFDTAPHYGLGLSERRLGRALRGVPRDDYVLSTKVGRLLVDNPGGERMRDTEGFDVAATKRRQWDLSRDGILRSIEDSLRRLDTDRIDIAYLHDPDDFEREALESALPALCELRDQGVLQAVGVGMNQSALPARFVEESDLDLVMVAGRFTLLEQGALADLVPAAQARGVGIVAAAVYNSGLLSKRRADEQSHYEYEDAPVELVRRANRIAQICEAHGTTLPEAAVAYPLTSAAVVSVVVGARSAQQVESNLRRHRATVQPDLWADLHDHGLLPSQPPSTKGQDS